MSTALGPALADLKETGCAVLVVGQAPPRAFRRASRRFFGDPAADRHRVLGLARGDAIAPDRWFPETVTVDAERCAVVGYEGEIRHRPDRGSLAREPGGPSIRTDGRDALSAFRHDLLEAIEAAGRRADPGALRVGIYSLTPLANSHGRETVRDLVDAVSRQIRLDRGIGHFHLPIPADATVADGLVQTCDAVVRVRQRQRQTNRSGGVDGDGDGSSDGDDDGVHPAVEQKWIVPESTDAVERRVETPWLALPDDD